MYISVKTNALLLALLSIPIHCAAATEAASAISSVLSLGPTIYKAYHEYKEEKKDANKRAEALKRLIDSIETLGRGVEIKINEGDDKIATESSFDNDSYVRSIALKLFSVFLQRASNDSLPFLLRQALRALERNCNKDIHDYIGRNEDTLLQGIILLKTIIIKTDDLKVHTLALEIANRERNAKKLGLIDLPAVQQQVLELLTELVQRRYISTYDKILDIAREKAEDPYHKERAYALLTLFIALAKAEKLSDKKEVAHTFALSCAKIDDNIINKHALELLNILAGKNAAIDNSPIIPPAPSTSAQSSSHSDTRTTTFNPTSDAQVAKTYGNSDPAIRRHTLQSFISSVSSGYESVNAAAIHAAEQCCNDTDAIVQSNALQVFIALVKKKEFTSYGPAVRAAKMYYNDPDVGVQENAKLLWNTLIEKKVIVQTANKNL